MPDTPFKKQRGFSPMEYGLMQSDGIAPEGIPRQCPKCMVWAHYTDLDNKKRGSCISVICPSCDNRFEIIKGMK